MPFHPRSKVPGGDSAVQETMERLEQHLAKENGIRLDGITCRLGRKLVIDAATETITGEPLATRLLTREYRRPFVLPEI